MDISLHLIAAHVHHLSHNFFVTSLNSSTCVLGLRMKGCQETDMFSCMSITNYMNHGMRKPVFGVCDQVRLKPACSATETSKRLEILHIETTDIIPSCQQTTKAVIRMRECVGWSAPLLFAYGKNRFSHDVAHMEMSLLMMVWIDSMKHKWNMLMNNEKWHLYCVTVYIFYTLFNVKKCNNNIQLLTIEVLDMMWYPPENTNIYRGYSRGQYQSHIQYLDSQHSLSFLLIIVTITFNIRHY